MKAIVAQPLAMPRIYRHFAVITVGVTFLIAVFADGENREAMAQSASKQTIKAPDDPPKETPGNERDDDVEGSFGSVGGQFGSPMLNPGGSHDNRLVTTGPQQVAASYNPTGLSDEEFARLSPVERERILMKLREQQFGASPEQRAQQVSRLIAASAQRSGSESGASD